MRMNESAELVQPKSNSPGFQDYLEQMRRVIDREIDHLLPQVSEHPQALHEALRYSALARAKRVRPILALTGFEALGGSDYDLALPPACALELLHTYSLIHDDLPCMDNDDLRRGLPTVHKKFGEGIAVLAGDALHDLAFQWTARSGKIELVNELAIATGSYGMIGGQVADMEAEGRPVTAEEIEFIHTRKTAALIRCAARFGGILAEADVSCLEALTLYGEKLGLAFQIIDDILDIEGDQAKLGKEVGSDEKNEKATYPAAVGLAESRRIANNLITEAIEALSSCSFPTGRLTELAKYIGMRES